MNTKAGQHKRKIAIIGGGPAGLFVYKRLVESDAVDREIHVYERKSILGAGMPYSDDGSSNEHVTNVSDNELPELVISIETWLKDCSPQIAKQFNINHDNFSEYKVVPRLLFGKYLSAQFDLLQHKAAKKGITSFIHNNCTVTDLLDQPDKQQVTVITDAGDTYFDAVVVCIGHHWPQTEEGNIPGYFDSPYPPAKLSIHCPHPVAIRGASLTAFDALKTLSRSNGTYHTDKDGKLSYTVHKESKGFRLVMHALDGLLPAIRIHVSDTHLWEELVLTNDVLSEHQAINDGFVSLDFLFQKNFIDTFRTKDPGFYEKIKGMKMEEFVDMMFALRERLDPFTLFRAEYAEAAKSIRRHETVAWKEMLAVLSFAMNYPAKHFSAEDMLRLKKVLMPLISIVIAFVPQSSAEELMALHDAGVLELISVDRDSEVIPKPTGGIDYKYQDSEGILRSVYYPVFVNCTGQPPLPYEQFPFTSLIKKGSISKARLRFRDQAVAAAMLAGNNKQIETDAAGNHYLQVSGLAINDHFQVLDQYGAFNDRIYMMAVPFIAGLNPDYSGLDFCEAASEKIVTALDQNAALS